MSIAQHLDRVARSELIPVKQPGHLLDKADNLVDTLGDFADDPMWADHAEVPKATLLYAVEILRELATLAKGA